MVLERREMFTIKDFGKWYGDNYEDDNFYGPASYQEILDDIGDILVQVDDEDYQGDSRVLYQKGNLYGILIFGWGSCSGCDALQGCGSKEEVVELANSLTDIDWKTFEEMKKYIETHDWEGDYSWHEEGMVEFLDKIKNIFGAK